MILLRNQKLYMASLYPNLDREVLVPRVPNDEVSRKGVGNTKTARSVFYTSIDDAISGLGEGLEGKIVYIYEPLRVIPEYKYKPDSRENPFLTNEVWYVSTCQVRLIMKVKINRKISDRKLKTYNPRLVERNFPKWSWSNLDRPRKMSKVVFLQKSSEDIITLKPEIKFYKSISDAVEKLRPKVNEVISVYKPRNYEKLEIIPNEKDGTLHYDKTITLKRSCKILITGLGKYKMI